MSEKIEVYNTAKVNELSEHDRKLIDTYLIIKENIRKSNDLHKKLVRKLKIFLQYPSLNSMDYFVPANALYQCFATLVGAYLINSCGVKGNDTIELAIASLTGAIICSPIIYISINYLLYECNKSRKMREFHIINKCIRPIFEIFFECYAGILASNYNNLEEISPQRLLACSYLGSFTLFLPTHITLKSLRLAADSLEVDNSIPIPLAGYFINAQENIIFDEAKISLDKIHEAQISTNKIDEDKMLPAKLHEASIIT